MYVQIFVFLSYKHLAAEHNSTSDPVCLSVSLSVCLSQILSRIFHYIIEEVIEVDELDEGNISAAAGK